VIFVSSVTVNSRVIGVHVTSVVGMSGCSGHILVTIFSVYKTLADGTMRKKCFRITLMITGPLIIA